MNPCNSRGLCSLFASLSESPFVKASGATTVRLVCCLFLEQLLLFFLYPLSSKRKCRDVCVCFRGGKRSPDRLLSGLKWMGWARRSYSLMGREVEAASAPLFVSTLSVSHRERCWVRGEQKLRNCLVSQAVQGVEAGSGTGEGDIQLVFFFYY